MIEEYIYLCKIFGGCYDLIQTNGGNISIKEANTIIIKKSGFKLIETELNKGYVLCDINKIKKKIELHDENINECIIEGEKDATPSIETFFHLLPKKYIVHLHPTYLLYYLSLFNWVEEIDNIGFSFKYIYVNYHKPGLELSNMILNKYKNENVIFLQNHGLILCDDSIDNLFNHIYEVNKKLETKLNIHITDIYFLKNLYTLLPNSIIKSIYIKNIIHDRYFYKLSPDIFLYLGEYPIIMESAEINIEKEINKYKLQFKKAPTVIIQNNIVYCISNKYNNLKNIEEMVQLYYQIISLNVNTIFNEINNKSVLENWEKEKIRLL